LSLRLTTLAVSAALVAVPALPQSLAELAAREKERRQKLAASDHQTYTDEDLKTPRTGTAPSGTASSGGQAGGDAARTGSRRASSGESSGEGPSDSDSMPEVGTSGAEKQWRETAQQQRDAISDAEKRIAEAQKTLDGLRTGLGQPQPSDGLRQQPLNPLIKEADREAAEKVLAEAQAALEKARQDQAAFEEKARKARVPPGWLR
jgi:hypothetical protein